MTTEQTVEVTPEVDALVEPLTRVEREEMKALSTLAYGKAGAWQKTLQKGELEDSKATTANGDEIKVKRLKYFTVQQIKERMEKIIADNAKALEEANKKAAEETKSENPNS